MKNHQRPFEGPSGTRDCIDLRLYFHSIDDCLQAYRPLKMHVESALDEMTLELSQAQSSFRINAKLWSTAQSKVVSAALIEHIERQMAVYEELCKLYDSERRFGAVFLKFIYMPENNLRIPTNKEIATHYECNERTVSRDLELAKQELKLLLFGPTIKKNES